MFGYSRQVYYRAIKAEEAKKQRAQKVVSLVQEKRMSMPRLGTRKLYHLLQPELQALGVGRDKLFHILKANHMLIQPKKSYHITTNSHHRFRKHKNVIADLPITRPEQLWVADITYVGTRENPMYLALVTDAYSKKIVGYNVSNSLSVDGALSALKQAIKNRKYPSQPLIHHSDRGLQYCSTDYQKQLAKAKITCSMTESYDPYANAIAERINGILKQEFIEVVKADKLDIMKPLVEDSVSIYNKQRPHLSCQMNTPEQMHKQDQVKIKSYKKQNLGEASFTKV
ncbi:transposase [Owenweeksia hongkongensis DSM 17368]|uniref:Transposase n=2 Tax=Owenweeksia TaxID=267986 RepID=G8R6V8_OWEHD|nr:transposase [Owenweeksia hongkongensis DSM 17368]AEV31983.1 transposase [Owenweeksia hongkongensis DSM 17368]AEV32293.1 transposase [Owenweeksia hongkongensis DSM 17368]AEV32912.1 transposase [Owenweeksia hongkongensis DSM 17368]AEV32976.1 transposase [Owenweeksia hongkongensis DSM 17368]